MNLKFKLKRVYVKSKVRRARKRKEKMINSLSMELKIIYDLILKISKDSPRDVIFDNLTGEILLAQRDLLIVINNYEVSIDNHTGFTKQKFPSDVYELMVKEVNKNAHRYRRKLKYEATKNLRKFLLQMENYKKQLKSVA